MRVLWRAAVACGLIAMVLAGCSAAPRSEAAAARASASDPDARAFTGTIISLRPTTSTMMISKDEHHGRDAYPNQILVKYDAATKFFLDDAPTTLDRVEQYMTVAVAGHMREGQMFAESAKFSSILPRNVRRPEAARPQ